MRLPDKEDRVKKTRKRKGGNPGFEVKLKNLILKKLLGK
jgi:hypothetical protein